MSSKRVFIAHPDGREYGIEASAFTDKRVSPEGSYAERGFHIVSNDDGTPYDGPKNKRELDQAEAVHLAELEARRAEKPAKPRGD